MICNDISAPFLFIFSETTPYLLYFSHIPTALIAVFLGLFIYSKTKSDKKNKMSGLLLSVVSLLFFTWSFADMVLWTNVDSGWVGFVWSLINFIALLISVFTLYFSYIFLEKKDVDFKYKLFFGVLLGIYLIFIATDVNLLDFNLAFCEPEQGPLVYYFYFLELLFYFWAVGYLIKKNITVGVDNKKVVAYFSIGTISFLTFFSMANIVASITVYWDILHYGLFGMPIFIGLLAYLIVEYKAFNIRLLAAQLLVFAVIILVGSQLFFIQNPTNRILTIITLLLVSLFGWWLVRSVDKEAKQKEQLEVANIELMKLDQAKSDFINIASHQLRTPISVIQGVASMLLDGDIDKMPQEERQRFYEAVWIKSKKLQTIINDILNASKIDNKVSEMDQVEDVDIPEILKKVTSDFTLEAKERDIVLVLDVPKKPISIITGQKKYLEEVFVNLINNAIKYTPSSVMTNDVRKVRSVKGKAKVAVKVREDKEKGLIMIEVKDNGIGIPEKSAHSLFKKFARADNAVKMYTDGSGLGLYIVREVIEDHGGRVWFESKVNIGTTFFVELPTKTKKVSDVRRRILGEK